MRNVALATVLGMGLTLLAPPARAGQNEPIDWRQIATQVDRTRLRNWRRAWIDALAHVRKSHAADIAAGGALFDPDRAFSGALPPIGPYRCRVYKLGAKGTAMAEFTSYPSFACRVGKNGELTTFYKLEGAQRPAGVLFDDSPARAVFLGTLVIGDEKRAMRYGRDESRDLVGYVERVGDQRWRLVLPYPRFESILDIVELVPDALSASPQAGAPVSGLPR